MNKSYSVAWLIEDTCPRCGRNLVIHTAIDRSRNETHYIQRCPGRGCRYHRVQRVFRILQGA